MLTKRLMLVLFALATLALAASDATRAQSSRPELTEEFHQTYPLTADGRVSLQNINGGVRVSAWDRNEVKIDAVKRAYTQERLQEAKINVDAGPAYVRVETEYPQYNWRDDGERHENPASVEYTLSVPRGSRLEDIDLVNGSLTIEGVAGPVHASSVNGRVTASGLAGTVNLSVVNGQLEATLDRLNESGTISLSSVNGPLVVTLPSDSNATVRANTLHGPINNDFKLPVREGEYVGRDLEGRLGQGSARVRLSNVNGSITIRRANDNRPVSPAVNLLSETREEYGGESDAREAAREAREAQREAQSEARDAAREAERDKRESQTDAESERQDAEREKAEAKQEAEREKAEAKADAESERADAEREAEQTAREVQREAERAARDTERATRDAVRENGYDDSHRQVERESKSFAVAGTPRVRVETFDGAIYVHAWDKPEVSYTATRRAGDEHEMKGIKIQAQGSGGEVTLRADFDKTFAHIYREQGGRVISFNSNASTEFDVYVPRNATLFVSSGDGRLRIEGVSGEIDLHTGDGSIDVSTGQGRLHAETGDGRIRVDGFDGDAEARTGDGRITLDGNFKTLTARTGDGTISLSVPDGTNATVETDAESVFNDGVAVAESPADSRVRRWRIGGGGQVLKLNTGDGQIILRKR
ncbi:MAG TPA: DUF4097 family beta strand repeat-containing protein [Pyrinomonadaceae bacterium]|nr:DUF4097 family beta strand repeat-containing protein [Pyrinomonadaceae bacterium]